MEKATLLQQINNILENQKKKNLPDLVKKLGSTVTREILASFKDISVPTWTD